MLGSPNAAGCLWSGGGYSARRLRGNGVAPGASRSLQQALGPPFEGRGLFDDLSERWLERVSARCVLM